MLPDPISIHPMCECYLDGKWLACDVTFDKATYLAATAIGIFPQERLTSIEWDGRTDSKCVSDYVLEDHGVHASYDDVSRKVADENRKRGPKFVLRAVTRNSNRKTAILRQRYSGNI